MGDPSPEAVRARRSASVWTRVHPLFAIGQLAAFAVSVSLLVAYWLGNVSYEVVHDSVLVKIALMVGAIVTGALWERDVYGKFWFADQYLGEDTMTVNVLILHVAYLMMAATHPELPGVVVGTLVLAYGVYLANVAQYIIRNREQHAVRVRA